MCSSVFDLSEKVVFNNQMAPKVISGTIQTFKNHPPYLPNIDLSSRLTIKISTSLN